MSFINHISSQREKLNTRDYMLYLWEEICGKNDNREISSQDVTEFNNHLPLLLEQFWEDAVEKLNECDTLDETEEDLNIYLLVLIYQCITQSHELISYSCVIHATELYMNLLTKPQKDVYFKSKLYLTSLDTLKSMIENTTENTTNQLVFKLRLFLNGARLNNADLEFTLATLIHIIFVKSTEVFQSFEIPSEPKSSSYEAFLSLKILLEEEIITTRKFLITTYFFNGLRKHNAISITSRQFNIIQMNFRNLIRNLHNTFKEDLYKTFLNAFIHVLKHPDVTYFGEAVLVINNLKDKHYQTLLDCLNKMLMTKNPHKNLFKLSLSIMCLPPKHLTVDKIKINNEILLKHILLNCVSSKNEVSNAALESLAELLMSPDLEKQNIKETVKVVLNCENDLNMTVPILLKGLQSLISKKWGQRSKNKILFPIIISIILFCEEDYPEVFRDVLDSLTEQCSPYDLKPFLSLLSETYIKMLRKNYKNSGLQILKILFRMALHPMASSSEFVKYLYFAMVSSTVYKQETIKREYFIDPIITEDFNFGEFFQKCNVLGVIRNEHVAKLIGNIPNISESDLTLLCAITHYTEYKELSIIADYVNDNFMTVCNSPTMNYLLFIYDKILKNNTKQTNNVLRCNEIMLCFLKHHLLRQNFRWNCVANAFALLKSFENITNLSQDFQRFKEKYEADVLTTLQNNESFLPLLYYSQLVIFGKITPSDEVLKLVTDKLISFSDSLYSRSPQFDARMWIGCLFFYSSVCIVKHSLVDDCLQHLRIGLNSSNIVVKLASINMTFDLCNMITHNFEDMISYMFKQLVYGDNVFKKTCLLKVDRLIRDDYLKLDLEQFLIFVSPLADRNISLSDYCQQLFSESFFMSNVNTITRYFVPLIVHINRYRKHPLYKINSHLCELIDFMSVNVLDRRKMYSLLFKCLPVKNQFSILFVLCNNVLESLMKATFKLDEGFWKMVKDSIFIFKLMSSNSDEDESGDHFYKKVDSYISKFLLQKTEFSNKSLYPEYHKEIVKGTEILLKLVFFNDSKNIQEQITLPVFDTIMHWTNFFLADLVHIVQVDRNEAIQSLFSKFNKFYKTNEHNLRYNEESFENSISSRMVSRGCSRSLFNVGTNYIPDFGDS